MTTDKKPGKKKAASANKPPANKAPAKSVAMKDVVGDALRILREQGQAQALAYLQQLAAAKDAVAVPLSDRLTVLATTVQQGDPKTALALAEKSIELAPDSMEARVLAGALQDRLGDRKASEATMLHVVNAATAKPDQVVRAANLLVRFGPQEIALSGAKAAYEKLGRPLRLASTLLYIAQVTADWELVASLVAQIRQAYQDGKADEVKESPRTNLLWCDDEGINIQVVQQWSRKSLPQLTKALPPAVAPLAGRRLRLAYLSSDFRDHPTSRLINGMLRHHDRTQFELFMYCSSWDDGSKMRRQIESHFDHVHSVAQLSDENAAALIRSHGIDVLIELNGPTRANRMGILAHRPAPVQIDYLGWPGSVGGRVVDYVVVDDYTAPPEALKRYPEKVINLQKTYQVNDVAARTLPPAKTRAEVGLPAGDTLVLGMFNAINKVHGEVWTAWMQILQAVPNSVLWLLDPGPLARRHIAAASKSHGIGIKRIVVAPRLKEDEHLARLQHCDLMLDPWPYGGHTSTSDALFAGVPVIALAGSNFASRVSGGLLRAAGMQQLVQPDVASYVKTAVALLRSPVQLAKVKRFVKEQVPHSDVFNAVFKTRQMEMACRHALTLAAQGKPAVNIRLSPKALASAQPNAVPAKRRLVLVCGPWSSGTSALAGFLGQAGLAAPGPFFAVNDPRTPATFEMQAFREVLVGLASEQTLEPRVTPAQALAALREFRDGALADACRAAGVPADQPVMLKHALAVLFLPELAQLFDLQLVGVLRPYEAIEETRRRRKWPAHFGQAGATRVYGHLFKHLVDAQTAYCLVRYTDLMAAPARVLGHLAGFCRVQLTQQQQQAALAFVSRPAAPKAKAA